MDSSIEQIHQVFFEESFEGLHCMESSLLNLGSDNPDSEIINSIFRAAHSIKGGAGTFGFMAISEFTHGVETLLGEMRDGKRAITPEAVQLLLQTVDCLRDMLTAARNDGDIDETQVADMQARLQTELASGAAGDDVRPDDQCDLKDSRVWRIAFRPHTNLMQRGSEPLRIFRELQALGELDVKSDISQLPTFSELDPEHCHVTWELTLHTNAGREQIEAAFEWAEGDCQLLIETPTDVGPPRDSGPDATRATGSGSGPEPAAKSEAEGPIKTKRSTENVPRGNTESSSIRVNIHKIDSLLNLVGELVITQSMLNRFSEDFDLSQIEDLRDALAQLDRNMHELHESAMQIRMLPISFAFNRFPRLVHDLSSALGKKVRLTTRGEHTELDKTVLEKIGDPLVHLVRNSLDHGLETPEVRRSAGKPETSNLELNAYHEGGSIIIEVRDDGAGINKEKVLEKARAKGLVSDDEELSDDRINNLIFQPGFSTAEDVSDISGRGVGMDVVRRNINDLNGHVQVKSAQGRGSTFTIRLPLTVAIMDGQLVRVGDERYVVPLVSIVETIQLQPERVKTLGGKNQLYRLRDEYLPVIPLYELFGIEPDSTNIHDGLLVVVEANGRRAGILVDELRGQQQVVIKSLEANYQHIEGLSGATILGNGTVALILDAAGLVQRFSDSVSHGSGH